MFNEMETKVADVGSVGIVIGTLAGYLPQIAAALSVVWMIIRLAETQTVQQLLKRYLGVSWIDYEKKGPSE